MKDHKAKGFATLHGVQQVKYIKFNGSDQAMEMMHFMNRVDSSTYWFCYRDRGMDYYFVDNMTTPYCDDENYDQVGDTY